MKSFKHSPKPMRPLVCFWLSCTLSACASAGAVSDKASPGLKLGHVRQAEAFQTQPAKGLPAATTQSNTWLNYYRVSTGAPLAMLPVPGQVTPLESNIWAVSPRIAGRIDSLKVMLGQRVVQGQRVALVRSSEFADLWRDLKLSAQQQTLRSQELKNALTLTAAHAIAQKDLKEAEESAREADLNHQASLDKLNVLNVSAEGENAFWLTAPHAGVVFDVSVTAGQEVGPESEPLIRISQLDRMVVTAQALETDVDGLKPGQYAQVSMPGRGDQRIQARILSVSQAVDPDQHTVPVRLLVSPAPAWLRPNSFVQVSFSRQAGKALLVPTEAVVTDDLKSIVFVKNSKTAKLERRTVILGRQGSEMTEIVSGLHAGELIVAKGAILLLNEVNS